MEELLILDDTLCGCVTKPNNVGANAQEMVELFKEALPYSTLDTINGQCIMWNEDFIDKILVAMATGSLGDFSDIEKQVWYAFVEFQDALSHSAPNNIIGAIGCTIPDALGNSYVVTNIGVTPTLCMPPENGVAKEKQSQSLDEYLMNLYNCKEPNVCGLLVGDVTDISPCVV